jgi:hypothetical protein
MNEKLPGNSKNLLIEKCLLSKIAGTFNFIGVLNENSEKYVCKRGLLATKENVA